MEMLWWWEGEESYVGEQSKGDNVQDEEDEVGRPVQEAASEGKEEDQGEEYADGGDHLSVDETLLGPC
jgi:hypothetical protein